MQVVVSVQAKKGKKKGKRKPQKAREAAEQPCTDVENPNKDPDTLLPASPNVKADHKMAKFASSNSQDKKVRQQTMCG